MPASEGIELTYAVCTHCGARVDNGEPPAPEPGYVTICIGCGNFGIYTETGIRTVTAEEEAEFMRDDDFRRLKAMAEVLVGLEHVGHLEGHVDEDGTVHLDGDVPPGLAEVVAGAIHRFEKHSMAEDIKKHVTAEVANHVLSVYGDEEASMPSVAVGALISLIRLCNESDDGLLFELNNAGPHVHGYVLGVVVMAEKPGGLDMLRLLAGLREEK